MHKKVLLALLLAVTLLMSGCGLIEKDETVEKATEVIRVYDTAYTKGEVDANVAYELEYMTYVYQMFGIMYDPTDPAIIADTRAAVVNEMVEDVVIRHKIAELGVDQLTAEEEEQLQTSVNAAMENYRFQIKSGYFADSTLSEEEIAKQVDELLTANGVTVETVTDFEKNTLCKSKLRTSIENAATITEQEVVDYFNTLVENDKANFELNHEQFATNINNGLKTYYRPAGYRMVKQILIGFSYEESTLISELKSKVNDANNNITNLTAALASADPALVESLKAMVTVEITIPEGGDASDAEALVDAPFGEDVDAVVAEQVKQLVMSEEGLAFYSEQLEAVTAQATAAIDAEADDVLAQLAAGADWDTLMLEKTDDPGMQAESITSDTGYAVCANYSSMDPVFVDTAMALENVGDVSDKVMGIYGYYIIKYVADVPEGPVALDDVRATVETSVLANAKADLYEETLAQWVAEAKPVINWDELNK